MISSQLVTLDVGDYGEINPDLTAFDYQTFFTPVFDGSVSVRNNLVWTANSNFLDGQYIAQGDWLSANGIPAPENWDQGDGIVPIGNWYMIGGQMSGTTIAPILL